MHVDNQPHLVEVAAALKEITARITSASTLDEAINGLLTVAADILPAHLRCAVTIISEGEPASYAATDLPPEVLDEGRYAGGDGPGMEAVRTRDIVLSQDLTAEPRWPVWGTMARGHDIHAVLAYPFDVDAPILGALTLYADRTEAFTQGIPVVAMLVADHASLLLRIRMRQLSHEGFLAQVSDVQIGAGAESVERAVGIIMAQRGCAPEQALRHLHDAATHLGVGLPAVAERLVRTVSDRATTAHRG